MYYEIYFTGWKKRNTPTDVQVSSALTGVTEFIAAEKQSYLMYNIRHTEYMQTLQQKQKKRQ